MALHEDAKEFISKGYGLAADSVRKRHLVPKSIAVGVFAGLAGVALRLGSEKLLELRHELFHEGGASMWIAAGASGAAFGVLAVWIVRKFCPEAGGGGITQLQQVVGSDTVMRWPRLIIVKTISLFSASAAGMGGGPEAPAIHVGGAVGKGVAATLHVKPGEGEHKALMSAGAAAGLSAAFNAPLSGLVFALEELQGNFDSKMLVSALLASVSADIVGRSVFGPYPVFIRLHQVAAPDLHALPFALLLGLIAGVVGVVFNRWVVRAARHGATAKSDKARLALGGVAGLVTGLAMLWIPGVAGGGGELVRISFTQNPTLMVAGGLFLARFASTLLFTATGAAGGFLIPLLAMGALAGHMLGDVVGTAFPTWVPAPGVLAVVGMGAFFSASIRAPLTGLVLMLELTGNYGFMLPTLAACLTAHLVAEEFGDPPVYHALRPGGENH
jgi:CIC family chloride channel protein